MDHAAKPSGAGTVDADHQEPVGRQQPGPGSQEPIGPQCAAQPGGLADLFIRRVEPLRRILAGMGLAPADAEDVLQDVFIEASRRPAQCRNEDEATGWLVRVTVNRALLEFRRRRRFERSAEQILRSHEAARPASEHPDQQAIRAEEVEAVRRAMQELDGALLVPLALRYFSEMDSTRIGEVLALPASTVRSRLREARLILAAKLKGLRS